MLLSVNVIVDGIKDGGAVSQLSPRPPKGRIGALDAAQTALAEALPLVSTRAVSRSGHII